MSGYLTEYNNRRFAFLLLVIISFYLIIPFSSAQVTETDCFSYYNFQNGLLFEDFHVDKLIYSAGEKLIGTYSIISDMEAPIVEGSVLIRILYNDNGEENVVDEFVNAKDVYLFSGSIIDESFTWRIPADAKPGEYAIKSFFIVANKFNLAGVNFIDSIPGTETTFTVQNSGASNYVHFNKSATFVNDRKYEFIAFTNTNLPDSPIIIKTSLVNEASSSQSQSLTVSIRTYRWDDAAESNEISNLRKTISVNLAPGKKEDITYQIDGLSPDAYLVVFTVKNQEGKTVSIMKIRLSIGGSKGRFVYLGLDIFPLAKDETTTAFFCMANAADYTTYFNGTGYVEILDENKKSIFKSEFGPVEIFSSPPQGWKVEFTPSKSYSKLYERAAILGEDGQTMDTVEVLYDYSKFAGIERVLTIDAGSGSPGSELKYTITYEDDGGIPLSGEMIVYLVDSSDKIVAEEKVSVSGIYKDGLMVSGDLPLGSYILKVQELKFNLNDSVDVVIGKGFDFTYLIIGIIILALGAALFLRMTHRI